MNNLVLPICPRCNDTKFVTERNDYNGLTHSCKHHCSQCDIVWEGNQRRRSVDSYSVKGSPKYYNP